MNSAILAQALPVAHLAPAPLRTRLSAPSAARGQVAARLGLQDAFERLADEQVLSLGGLRIRVGLATTPWQRAQAMRLLPGNTPVQGMHSALALTPLLKSGSTALACMSRHPLNVELLMEKQRLSPDVAHLLAQGQRVFEISLSLGESSKGEALTHALQASLLQTLLNHFDEAQEDLLSFTLPCYQQMYEAHGFYLVASNQSSAEPVVSLMYKSRRQPQTNPHTPPLDAPLEALCA